MDPNPSSYPFTRLYKYIQKYHDEHHIGFIKVDISTEKIRDRGLLNKSGSNPNSDLNIVGWIVVRKCHSCGFRFVYLKPSDSKADLVHLYVRSSEFNLKRKKN